MEAEAASIFGQLKDMEELPFATLQEALNRKRELEKEAEMLLKRIQLRQEKLQEAKEVQVSKQATVDGLIAQQQQLAGETLEKKSSYETAVLQQGFVMEEVDGYFVSKEMIQKSEETIQAYHTKAAVLSANLVQAAKEIE